MAVITGHQLHVKYQGDSDVTLQMIAESSAITQRPDYIYGLIHSANMKSANKFHLKLLKGRDTSYVGYRTEFQVAWNNMRLTGGDNYISPDDIASQMT